MNGAQQFTLFDPAPPAAYGWGRPCWLVRPPCRRVVTVTVKGGYL